MGRWSEFLRERECSARAGEADARAGRRGAETVSRPLHGALLAAAAMLVAATLVMGHPFTTQAASKPSLEVPVASPGTVEPDDPVAKIDPAPPARPPVGVDYREVVRRTAEMVSNSEAVQMVSRYGLQILNVTWEDTGRYKGSCVGPNISDMTLQVQQVEPRSQRYSLTCLPVIRFPNFSDRTGDVRPDQFYLLVGNEKGRPLRRVSLREFLGNLRDYLHTPSSWKGSRTSLLAERDTHVLVSAQACFLPIPRQGKAEFNPVLFNYQSVAGDPAVLTILATREGTSVTVIDNNRDGFAAGRTWGQRLFFNQDGERASLTGERQSDFEANQSSQPGKPAGVKPTQGLNMVLLIQVPLKQKTPPVRANCDAMPAPCSTAKGGGVSECSKSDVENAVVGHGKVEGPFTEVADLDIERDPNFPIRVTVQFYKATSNGVVSAKDVADIHDQIEKVYAHAEYVGSLVTEGETGRPTEYHGNKKQPADWWSQFWMRYEKNTGQGREEAREMQRRLLRLHEQQDEPRRPDSIPLW